MTDERDVVAEVEAAFAYHDAEMNPVEGCRLCSDDAAHQAERFGWLRDLLTRCEQAEQERDGLRAEVERLTGEAYQRFVADREHCKDCCCARSWQALGVTTNTGRSIPEHIEELVQKVAAHEQDIEAARLQGWDDAMRTTRIKAEAKEEAHEQDVEAAVRLAVDIMASYLTQGARASTCNHIVARFGASRKGGSDD